MTKKCNIEPSVVLPEAKVNAGQFTRLTIEEAHALSGGWVPWVPGYLQDEEPNPFWEGVPYKN